MGFWHIYLAKYGAGVGGDAEPYRTRQVDLWLQSVETVNLRFQSAESNRLVIQSAKVTVLSLQ